MQHRVRRTLVYVLIGMGCLFVPALALAGDGWYMGMDLGVAHAPGPDTATSDNDYPTTCDMFIDPAAALGDQCSPGESWSNEFDAGTGVLAGISSGYRWGSFRIEGEYFYRGTIHDSAKDPLENSGSAGLADKNEQELVRSEEAIDDVLSHNFFANLYYDFTSGSKWTPYLGVGVGFAHVSIDYSNLFRRNINPARIRTFPNPMGGIDPRNQTLAGTTTIARSRLSDTLFGYQAIAGLDYQLRESVTIGLKFRWAGFSEFEDGAEYAQLRSHDSTNSRDTNDPRSARVRYAFTTDDLTFWGLSLNLKYQF